MSAEPLEIVVRTERGDDPHEVAEIGAVVAVAFGSDLEANLLTAIRVSPNYLPEAALVAEHEGRIVGHVMVSYVDLDSGLQTRRVASLSPLAVTPDVQRRGVGSALVRSVVDVAERGGEPLVVLEGSPAYYGRLGFEPSAPRGIEFNLPSWAPPDAAQLVRLSAYDPAITGTVVYPDYFPSGEEVR